jgi:predicted protein tyrosine phosphatase
MNGKKAIHVLSRYAAEAAKANDEPHIIISINCPGDDPARIRENRATLGRVNLFFWDLDKVPEDGGVRIHGTDSGTFCPIKEEDLCQPSDAAKIIDLVDAHPEAEDIIVHCTAGKSRSAAIAAALHKVLNGSDEPIFGNKRYTPNMRVYRMVLDEWYTRHPLE